MQKIHNSTRITQRQRSLILDHTLYHTETVEGVECPLGNIGPKYFLGKVLQVGQEKLEGVVNIKEPPEVAAPSGSSSPKGRKETSSTPTLAFL